MRKQVEMHSRIPEASERAFRILEKIAKALGVPTTLLIEDILDEDEKTEE